MELNGANFTIRIRPRWWIILCMTVAPFWVTCCGLALILFSGLNFELISIGLLGTAAAGYSWASVCTLNITISGGYLSEQSWLGKKWRCRCKDISYKDCTGMRPPQPYLGIFDKGTGRKVGSIYLITYRVDDVSTLVGYMREEGASAL